MEKIVVYGGNKLDGKLNIKSAKNAVLPILAGAILCKDKVKLSNIPNLTDIHSMCEILESLGCTYTFNNGEILLDSENINSSLVSQELSQKLRASIFLLGPLLSLNKKAKMSYPGGCNIGNRPIDISLNGLKSLGVEIKEEHGFIICDGSNMKPSEIYLRFPSVGATENLIMASVFLDGITTLNNCAKEPEIVDLANFLNSMGAKIYGAGSCKITIVGVKKLQGVEYKPICDRIVIGTYILGTLICGGDVELGNTNIEFVSSLVNKLANNDCLITHYNDRIRVQASKRLKAVPFVETLPYPEFPTDLQSAFMSFSCYADGVSVIKENLFESRFKHVPELIKMGANIETFDNIAIVKGKEMLSGASVKATDLRAGASLVLAGLKADGYTTISDVYHIDRGYDHIENDLKLLGANIERLIE